MRAGPNVVDRNDLASERGLGCSDGLGTVPERLLRLIAANHGREVDRARATQPPLDAATFAFGIIGI